MARMDQIPGAAFVYGGYREVDLAGTLLFERLPSVQEDEFEALLRGNHIAMHGTVLYDARVLRENGGFDERLVSCEDYDVYLGLALRYPIASYQSIAAEYRRHADNLSRDALTMLRTSRSVILKQCHSGALDAAQLEAAKEGLDFMVGYYGREAVRQVRALVRTGRIGQALAFAARWLRADPMFAARLLRRRTRRSAT
jgi:hypothetical protein